MNKPRTFQSRENVQAMRFDGSRESADSIQSWLDEVDPAGCLDIFIGLDDPSKSSIWLMQSNVEVCVGEWLIRDTDGRYSTRTDAEFATGFQEIEK